MKLLLTLTLLPALLLGKESEESEAIGLQLSLICENESIVAGEPFAVGLHLQHRPDYHTYWKSPGIVGIATQLDWQLPPGFTASDITWPYPQLCDMAGHPCHGYERDVTLLVTITPPAKITSPKVTLRATATWMCCAETCHPGTRKLSLTLPVATKSESNLTSSALIQKATKEVPPQSQDWTVQLLSKIGASPLTLSFQGPDDDVPEYFFSSDGEISSDKKQIFRKTAPHTWELSIPRATFAPENQRNLTGVLKTSHTPSRTPSPTYSLVSTSLP